MRKAIGPGRDRRARSSAPAVCIRIGVVLALGGCASVPKNLRNLNAGCEQGSGSSCFQLGVAYHEGKDEKGEFVDLNFAKARRAFERACDRESSTGCYNLGFMLQKGEGGSIDKPRALGFYKRGCELGDGSACMKAAVAFRDGEIVGVKKDAEMANFYARRGCDRDVKEACDLIGARPSSAALGSSGGSGLTLCISGLEKLLILDTAAKRQTEGIDGSPRLHLVIKVMSYAFSAPLAS